MNGCAVWDYKIWQDVRLAIDHEHASEFVSAILDAPGAQAASQTPKQRPTQTATQWVGPTVPATSTTEGRRQRKGKERLCKVVFFVFQDPNHGAQILSERTSFGLGKTHFVFSAALSTSVYHSHHRRNTGIICPAVSDQWTWDPSWGTCKFCVSVYFL